MNARHPLDLSRLELLRQQLEAGRGAATRAHESALEAHRRLGFAEMDLRLMDERASQNQIDMGHSELREKKKELGEKISRIKAEKADLLRQHEAAAERAQALGRLYTRCAEFVGVDPNAR